MIVLLSLKFILKSFKPDLNELYFQKTPFFRFINPIYDEKQGFVKSTFDLEVNASTKNE